MKPELVVHIAALLWTDYSKEANSRDFVKKETNDNTADWQQFHDSRLQLAEAKTEQAYLCYQEFLNSHNHREIINRMMGM